MRPSSSLATAAALLVAVLVSGCGVTERQRLTYEPEEFDSTTTHTRSYTASEAQTCEAARRALLSQGYMVTAANQELVTGRKSFQPATEVHVEVEFRVVCAREGGKSRSTIAFASALQDRYGVKKVNNSASVGVGAIGSLSLPFSSSDDAMVKVASETLTDDRFYDRFFSLIERYLPESIEPAAPPAEARPVAPQRPPAGVPLQLQSVPLSPSRG
ncbi:DUF2242 domain-containing protein [Variovorax ureilyticus]|uniref:DUF2242 domain-containing protein n=1 Tax=Variovorax ureilyticus TaxID=1836198 RepID=A0ABU8VCY4_9BURK